MKPSPSSSRRTWQVGTLSYSATGLAVLFGWLLWGNFAWSVRDRAIPSIMQLLFSKYGASDFMVGLLFVSLPAMLGLVIGPVVGYKSDRLRTRWGRRIPYLLATTPPLVLGLIGLAFAPQLGAWLHYVLGGHLPDAKTCVLIFLGILWTVFEISLVTANSVFGALINDVVPQEVVGRFFGLSRVVSLIVGMAFFFWLMGTAVGRPAPIFIGVGLIYGVGFSLMCFKVREGKYPHPPPTPKGGGLGSTIAAIRGYFHDGFGHPYFLWYFGATLFANLATGPVNIYAVFYAKSVSMTMGYYGKCVALTYFISFFLSYPLGAIADRLHPLRISMVVLVLYAAVMVYGFFYVRDAHFLAVALVFHGVVAGCYITTSASLNQRLLPRSKFAEISSAGGILNALAGIGVAPALGIFLDYEHHDYRYTFLAGFVFTVLAVIGFIILHGKFMTLGGPRHYVAPE